MDKAPRRLNPPPSLTKLLNSVWQERSRKRMSRGRRNLPKLLRGQLWITTWREPRNNYRWPLGKESKNFNRVTWSNQWCKPISSLILEKRMKIKTSALFALSTSRWALLARTLLWISSLKKERLKNSLLTSMTTKKQLWILLSTKVRTRLAFSTPWMSVLLKGVKITTWLNSIWTRSVSSIIAKKNLRQPVTKEF